MNLTVENRPVRAELRRAPATTDPQPTVQAAIHGDQDAWRELYRRYNPLVIATAAKFRMPLASIEDVSQTVWSLLVRHLPRIREPKALPAWIVTTTRNEALRTLRIDARCAPLDPAADRRLEGVDRTEPGANIYQAELRQSLDVLLETLSTDQRRLMRMLMADPQPSYAEISRTLSIPMGSIGPTRARCLARMRAHSKRLGEAFDLAA